MNKEQWEKEFDKKFVPKYPKSGFEPIDGLTANIFTIKDFIKDLLKKEHQEILQIVIEDVPHKYQKRLLKILKRKSSSIY